MANNNNIRELKFKRFQLFFVTALGFIIPICVGMYYLWKEKFFGNISIYIFCIILAFPLSIPSFVAVRYNNKMKEITGEKKIEEKVRLGQSRPIDKFKDIIEEFRVFCREDNIRSIYNIINKINQNAEETKSPRKFDKYLLNQHRDDMDSRTFHLLSACDYNTDDINYLFHLFDEFYDCISSYTDFVKIFEKFREEQQLDIPSHVSKQYKEELERNYSPFCDRFKEFADDTLRNYGRKKMEEIPKLPIIF